MQKFKKGKATHNMIEYTFLFSPFVAAICHNIKSEFEVFYMYLFKTWIYGSIEDNHLWKVCFDIVA